MRALKALVIAMGVLIVGATAALIVLIVLQATGSSRRATKATQSRASRAASTAGAPTVRLMALGEPEGSRILAMARVANGLALALGGGGEADRIVIVDPTSGRVVGRIHLSR